MYSALFANNIVNFLLFYQIFSQDVTFNGSINVQVNFLGFLDHQRFIFFCTGLILKFGDWETDGSKASISKLSSRKNISFPLKNAHFSRSLTTKAIFSNLKSLFLIVLNIISQITSQLACIFTYLLPICIFFFGNLLMSLCSLYLSIF